VLVHVEADDTTRAMAARMIVRAFDADGMMRYERAVRVGAAAGEVQFPATVPVVPLGGDTARRFMLVVELEDAGTAVFARQRVVTGFVPGELREVHVRFTADCGGMLGCGDDETCIAGSCESACLVPAPPGGTAERVPCGPAGACDGVAEGAECEGGRCRGGACCTGCWDEAAARCETGDTLAACGAKGVACGSCCDDDTACSSGACVPAEALTTIHTGFAHACTGAGTLRCWGANDAGQTGNGGTTDVTAPEVVTGRGDWGAIGLGSTHSCGITFVNELHCWGGNAYGQLGTGDMIASAVPVHVQPGTTWSTVQAGASHSCAVDRVGRLFCWGQNADGIVGDTNFGGLVADPTELGVGTTWASVDTFRRHACAVAGTDLHCWGLNRDGALEVGSGADGVPGPQPVTLDFIDPVVGFAAGGFHTCAITQAMPGVPGGGIRCWGIDAGGQLGRPPGALRTDPIGGITDFLQVTAGENHACAIRADGTLWCWGRNGPGQVGSGNESAVIFAPERVGEHDDWQQVDAGGEFTCGLREHGTLWCWGDNSRGQLGVPGSPAVRSPQRVCLPPPIPPA
jgi:alpha-tubulin suppressor-like RCC1 family protein